MENCSTTLSACVEELCSVPKSFNSTEDEILLGKAGYLFCLLRVRQLPGIKPDSYNRLSETASMVAGMLVDVKNTHPKDDKYLKYRCYGEYYCGAAHGNIGIIHVLLHSWDLLSNIGKERVTHTLNTIISCKGRGNNLPMIEGDTSSDVFHWCHGGPGLIPVLITASKVLTSDIYLQEAVSMAPLIAKYGLVLKGNSLCHGISGNAYALLSLYKATRDPEYLSQVYQFFHALTDPSVQTSISKHPDRQRRVQGIPDMPYSLMEGCVGVACFAIDLLDPLSATFPGWELQ
eukprot:TRINITY_DN3518_c0_g1_i3.p1 TRINITY_DN3518_c0_g1~~TRINITY_DN3518_c0_g1_i3.p1  ORF type:complete len:289 (+),score=34.86 TRINITY_DN3518_c0_g1_i3:452-1318(+)